MIFMFSLKKASGYCLVGGFISDKPTKGDIEKFQANFGKKPYLVMIFVDWENFVDDEIIRDVYAKECVLAVTWEPWYALDKKGINYNAIFSGKMDSYIADFAKRLKQINKPVFLRFAHEMNGDWYPWSASKIGSENYIAMYQYISNIFDKVGTENVKWIFSINWEDIPKENSYMNCYPGDKYVDLIGIDGYNWGNTKPWSKWASFKEIFEKRYGEIVAHFKKPTIISEFSSTSKGGNKTLWIKEAMAEIKKMKQVRAFVLFNVNKETDWSFSFNEDFRKELKSQLKDGYFKDKNFISN